MITQAYNKKLQDVLSAIESAVIKDKTQSDNNFINGHEAYAVVIEDVEGLWSEIKKNKRFYNLDATKEKSIQSAAMLCRLIIELL